MKGFLITMMVSLMFLSACGNSADNYINWTNTTEGQLERLDEANIKYDIREEEVWIRERDLDKAVKCCS